jgi:hypothetical protein
MCAVQWIAFSLPSSAQADDPVIAETRCCALSESSSHVITEFPAVAWRHFREGGKLDTFAMSVYPPTAVELMQRGER